jgi:hypothetical protein
MSPNHSNLRVVHALGAEDPPNVVEQSPSGGHEHEQPDEPAQAHKLEELARVNSGTEDDLSTQREDRTVDPSSVRNRRAEELTHLTPPGAILSQRALFRRAPSYEDVFVVPAE